MRVEFWGVRGSIPTPVGAEDVIARLTDVLAHLGQSQAPPDLSDRTAIVDWVTNLPLEVSNFAGGNTPCVSMTTDAGDLFIIDFGTGIRHLGNQLMKGDFGKGYGRAHLFLSHYHWDHIQGWPFFKPAYTQGNSLELYARHTCLKERLSQQQEAPFFPPAAWDDMRATINFNELDAEPFTLCDGRVKVSSFELNHPSRAYAYRFEADNKVFIYASDGAYLDLDDVAIAPYVEFFRDADLLIFDAQFTLTESFEKRTWGHSSAVIGVELACQANVKQLVLFHHDPSADEAQLQHMLRVGQEYAAHSPAVVRRQNQKIELILAREGMEIRL